MKVTSFGAGRSWPSVVAEQFLDRHTALGLAYDIFWASGLPKDQEWRVPYRVGCGMSLKQVAFSFSDDGRPEAFCVWAYVSDDVLLELQRNPFHPLHISDWNEGLNVWIAELMGRPGKASLLLRHLCLSEFALKRPVHGFRFRAGEGRSETRNWPRTDTRPLNVLLH